MKVLVAVLLLTICHILVWLQINGRLFSQWWIDNFWYSAILLSPIIFLIGYGYWVIMTDFFGGVVWPAKLIAYAINFLVFAVCAYYFLGELFFTIRNVVSLFFVLMIISAQMMLPKKHISEYFTRDEHPSDDSTKN